MEIIFVDFKKTYDMIARKLLWRVLEKREILKIYVKTVRNMYNVFQKCVWKNRKVYCKT